MATYSKDASKKKETGLTESQEAFRGSLVAFFELQSLMMESRSLVPL